MSEYYTGRIVRHKGERKVIRCIYRNREGKEVIQFVDLSECTDKKDIELNGKK